MSLPFRGLKGKYTHLCPDWDWRAIDETCWEFTCCICEANDFIGGNYEEMNRHKARLERKHAELEGHDLGD